MNPPPAGSAPIGAASMPEALARTLRHEVGDFLQRVYAAVAILQNRLPPDWTQERNLLVRLRQGAEDCKHLMDAIQDLLTPISLYRESVDLRSFAASLAANARQDYPGIEWVNEGAEPVSILADPERLQQMGKALLKNAAEADATRVVLQIGWRSGRQEIELKVTDNGRGVPLENLPKIFDPFFTTKAGHAGLGLALALKMCSLHGGEIRAEPLSGSGFEVTVTLPAHADENAAGDQVPASTGVATGTSPPGR